MFVRYEDLAARPRETLEEVCDFIGEAFDEQMLELPNTPDVRATKSNSSFGDLGGRVISTKAIGRFADVLEPREIDFVQTVSGKGMREFDYETIPVDRSNLSAHYRLVEFPSSWARMWAWRANARVRLWRGPSLPEKKMLDRPVGDPEESK
jgi:hypothetical protein